MTLYVDKLAILAKIEGTYGTDSTPTGNADAMQISNVRFTPLAGGTLNRDLVAPYMGHQGISLTGVYRQIEFDVELGGAGAAGDVPPYGALLRACGMSETVTEDTDVEYAPVSAGFEAVSLYYFLDGRKWALLGTRGKFTVDVTPQQKPKLHFTMSGLYAAVSDTALPSADYSAFVEPPTVNKANTTFTLDGVTPPMLAFSIDGGQQIEPRMLVNYEAIEHTDRQMTGSVTLDQVLAATKDWEAIALAETKVALALVHGTADGNIVELGAPAVQVGQLTHGDSQRAANNVLPLIFTPSSGNDELTITVR